VLNLKDIWIGEIVQIISSGRTGFFEGLNKEGKARINSKGKIYLATAKNLRLYKSAQSQDHWVTEEDQPVKKSISDFVKTLDLHIEKLRPDLETALPERILDYQVKAFENYLEEALSLGINTVTIVHGKGKGILKQSILALIKNDKRIKLHTEIHAGGALELLL